NRGWCRLSTAPTAACAGSSRTSSACSASSRPGTARRCFRPNAKTPTAQHDYGGQIVTVTYLEGVARERTEARSVAPRLALPYVTHYHSNSISVVDPRTHCGIAIALDDAPIDVAVRPESVFIYTANLHSVTAIDTSTAATPLCQ